MDPMRLMNDRKYGRTFLLLALFFLLSGGYLKLMALEKEDLSRSLEEENRQVEIFSKAPSRPSCLPFLESLFSAASPASLVNAAEEGGLKVDTVSEEEKEGENGIFHIFHISGTGTYAQIVQTFDIIKGKERWSAVNLRELKRSPKGLAYKMEVQTFQIRGTYEKEKYSPHRSHGHRQEPGGENTL